MNDDALLFTAAGATFLIALLYFVFFQKESFDGAKGEDPRLAWMRR